MFSKTKELKDLFNSPVPKAEPDRKKISYLSWEEIEENPLNAPYEKLGIVSAHGDMTFEASVKQELLEPLRGYWCDESVKYRLISGHRRFQVEKKKKSERIPFIEVDRPATEQEEKIQLIAPNYYSRHIDSNVREYLYFQMYPRELEKKKPGPKKENEKTTAQLAAEQGLTRISIDRAREAGRIALEKAKKEGRIDFTIDEFSEARKKIHAEINKPKKEEPKKTITPKPDSPEEERKKFLEKCQREIRTQIDRMGATAKSQKEYDTAWNYVADYGKKIKVKR